MSNATSIDDPLADYRWRHRVVLVLSPGADDPRAREIHAMMKARACEAAERDLVVVHAPANGPATADGVPMERAFADRVRATHGVAADDFLVLLVGKDGGAKLRSADVPDLQAWFDRIDGMPMRAAEMRTRGDRCGEPT